MSASNFHVTAKLIGPISNLDRIYCFYLEKESSVPCYCRECDVRFACNGDCPKHRFTRTPDGSRA
jgi:uncharacterized protein